MKYKKLMFALSLFSLLLASISVKAGSNYSVSWEIAGLEDLPITLLTYDVSVNKYFITANGMGFIVDDGTGQLSTGTCFIRDDNGLSCDASFGNPGIFRLFLDLDANLNGEIKLFYWDGELVDTGTATFLKVVE